MDNKDVKSTRKVINTQDYNWEKLEEEAENLKYGGDVLEVFNKPKPKKKKKKAKKPKKKRTQKEQKLFEARLRATVMIGMALVLVWLILILVPIFNVRNISISGNKIVTPQQVSELVGDVKGTNLFLVSKRSIKKKLKTIDYINEVKVDKKLIPPSIEITVMEHIPAAYLQVGSSYVVINSSLIVLDENSATDMEAIPCITGVKIKSATLGKPLQSEKEAIPEVISQILKISEENEILGYIISIDLSDLNNITFNYDNRITVNCGTAIDIDRKMRLFNETIHNENIAPDAVGTIDLSETGKAKYTP